MSSTLNKFKDLNTLGPHIQPQTITHRLEPVRKFLLFLVTDKQSQKSQAGIQYCRLSILIDRNRASPGMRYLYLNPWFKYWKKLVQKNYNPKGQEPHKDEDRSNS